jgi:hypothetical protein
VLIASPGLLIAPARMLAASRGGCIESAGPLIQAGGAGFVVSRVLNAAAGLRPANDCPAPGANHRIAGFSAVFSLLHTRIARNRTFSGRLDFARPFTRFTFSNEDSNEAVAATTKRLRMGGAGLVGSRVLNAVAGLRLASGEAPIAFDASLCLLKRRIRDLRKVSRRPSSRIPQLLVKE